MSWRRYGKSSMRDIMAHGTFTGHPVSGCCAGIKDLFQFFQLEIVKPDRSGSREKAEAEVGWMFF